VGRCAIFRQLFPARSFDLENESAQMMYRKLVRPLLFHCDSEWAHDQAITWCERSQRLPGFTRIIAKRHRVVDSRLAINVAGIALENPIGLAAGFDKSGRVVETMASFGFGHVEIGSISAMPSAGNPRPRLWRLPQDEAICVHYGLPNDGAQRVAIRLAKQKHSVPLGINLVNTNRGAGTQDAGPDEILSDYVQSAKTLQSFASYLMLNLSCPNTADGRGFFDHGDHLRRLLERITTNGIDVPVLLKLSPDGGEQSLDRLLETVDGFQCVQGFMFNLSPTRRGGLTTPERVWRDWPGAISGRPVRSWMDDRIAELYAMMDRNRYQIVAAGGVSRAEDAYQKIRCGASLVQVYTALLYQGPGVVRQINRGLLRLLRRDGFTCVADAVGVDVRG
jgi:dihydroorotate dehydrogenase (fumarate)/dihydroorotate dehydrogenase